jgi:hypothetical protein
MKYSLIVGTVDPAGCLFTLAIKGKAIPLQAWTGSKGSRRLRHPDFKTIDR